MPTDLNPRSRSRRRSAAVRLLAALSVGGLSLVALRSLEAGPKGEGGAAAGAVTGLVDGEIARRQKQMLEAEFLIADGDALVAEDEFEEAVLKFAAAYNRLSPSPLSDRLRATARDRYAAASVLHAQSLIEAAEFAEAERAIDRVLEPTVAPDYGPARKIKERLADPEWYNRARTPEHLRNVEDVKRLLVLGEGAMRLGEFDEALGHYTAVLRIDRTNSAARRGMEEAERAIIGYHRSSRDHTRARMIRQVDEAWETAVDITGAFGGDGPTGGTLVETLDRSIEAKLQSIMIDSVEFDDASLQEVLGFLTLKSQQADPLGEGVNFVLKIDPADQTAINARLNLKLRNIPLGEVVRYVTEDSGTSYRAEGYAVKIVSQNAASAALLIKRYRVPPDFLSTASIDEGPAVDDPFATPDAPGSGLALRRLTAKEFLEKQGVTFPEGASAVFMPGTSYMVVRNTQNNLNLIQTIVDNSFGGVPKQVEIYVTMIDIVEDELKELGFDWLLGQFNAPGSNRVFGSGGTLGNSARSGSLLEPVANFPFVPPGSLTPVGQNPVTGGLRSGSTWNDGDAIDSILFNGDRGVFSTPVSVRAPGLFSVAGIFTDPQFQVVMRGLSQSKSGDVITKPSIVTRSGQRAVIDIIREFPYPTEYDPPEIPQNFNGGGGGGFIPGNPNLPPVPGLGLIPVPGGGAPAFPITPAHPTAFETRPVGTHLEIEPVVSADNYTVELNLAPELVRFEGFINYGTPINTSAPNALGGVDTVELSENRILQPVFKTLRENTSVIVRDGATVVIGGLVEERTQTMNDKVPILGDAPLIGRAFRSTGTDRIRRVVMFMVKVHVIDPGGRRVNELNER